MTIMSSWLSKLFAMQKAHLIIAIIIVCIIIGICDYLLGRVMMKFKLNKICKRAEKKLNELNKK
jgi:membrane protein DedA with SNARE-associated domain